MREVTLTLLAAATMSLPVSTAAAGVEDVRVAVTAGPRPATLSAQIRYPDGSGPFPALVFMHGCAGLGRRQHVWAAEVVQDGYAVLLVDSFGARGLRKVCGASETFPGESRVHDVFAAARHLRTYSFVDGQRVGVVGWSHGGWATLWALAKLPDAADGRFAAAVTFYPVCSDSPGWSNGPPLLMLLGAQDNWTRADRCTRLAERMRTRGRDVVTVIYPDAHHAFDDAGLRRPTTVKEALGGKGATVAYDAAAHADARHQLRSFLARHLKGGSPAPATSR